MRDINKLICFVEICKVTKQNISRSTYKYTFISDTLYNKIFIKYISARQVKMQIRLLQYKSTLGIAQLNNNNYMLFHEDTFLPAYDAVSFERLEDVELSLEEGRPADGHSIVACRVNQCRYVADIGDNCIPRLEINNGGTTVKWMNQVVLVMCNNNYV